LTIAIAIPARLESTRFQRKVMQEVLGKTMLEHVWCRANLVPEEIDIFIISEDDEILEAGQSMGSKIFKSKKKHNNGTSRVYEFSEYHEYDHYVILQADELLIDPETIANLISEVNRNQSFTNVITNISNPHDLVNSNIVKCKLGNSLQIIDLSRYYRIQNSNEEQLQYTYKICGLYSIPRSVLQTLFSKPQTIISKTESIEQMQIIELGEEIKALEVARNDLSVNTPEEWALATEMLNNDEFQRKILTKYI
jgi:3-deoxy-manno-octulosonate cytidylyltransferase (CMP-KDO synthetase)